MNITTKLNVGDKMWMINKNAVSESKIVTITTDIYRAFPTYPNDFSMVIRINYLFENGISITEKDIAKYMFYSKKELLASL